MVRPLAETTLSGVVISANGEPVAGAGVTTWPAGRRLHSVGTAVTDEDGAFRVPILAGIDYDVVVGRRMPTGFQTGEIVVHANQPIENLRITIAR